jgi:hypothetical protein
MKCKPNCTLEKLRRKRYGNDSTNIQNKKIRKESCIEGKDEESE